MTTNYREILRLNSLGFNKVDIAGAAHCARNTVETTLERAKAWNAVKVGTQVGWVSGEYSKKNE